MKNIIKIVSSALIATLALTTVAFAAPSSQSNPDSAGTRGDAPTGQSNSDSAGTRGTAPGSQSNPDSAGTVSNGGNPDNGSSNGGSSNRRRSGGGTRVTASLTNVNVNVVGSKATVTWDTNPNAQGMLVYGPLSLTVPTNATQFYGYAAGTAVSGATTKHSHTFTMAPGVTYFVRPVAIVGSRVIYGSEIKVNATTGTTITKTGVPAVGTIFDKPTTTIPKDVEVTKATTTATSTGNAANVSSAGSKIGSFFKWIWNAITAPFCN